MMLFLFVTLSLYYLGAILFLRWGLLRLKPGKNTRRHSISVVIAARNEEAVIARCLARALDQDYPEQLYEVIVVNDRSTDNTAAVIDGLARQNHHLRQIHLKACPPHLAPKKHALSKGVQAAMGEIVLFTDADCVAPRTWLRAVNAHFTDGVGAVAGLTTYRRVPDMPGAFWGMQAVDFFSHAVVSAGAMGAGLPINTNANNFAVRKGLFWAVSGFRAVQGVVSGDDDLLLQAAARKKAGIRYAVEPEAAVKTEPTPTFRALWEQRKRWSSKTVFYNEKQIVFLSGVFLYYLLIFLGLVSGVFFHGMLWLAGPAFLFKTLLDYYLFRTGAVLFDQKALLPYFPLAALFHVPLILFACLFGVFGKFTWKGATGGKKVA